MKESEDSQQGDYRAGWEGSDDIFLTIDFGMNTVGKSSHVVRRNFLCVRMGKADEGVLVFDISSGRLTWRERERVTQRETF